MKTVLHALLFGLLAPAFSLVRKRQLSRLRTLLSVVLVGNILSGCALMNLEERYDDAMASQIIHTTSAMPVTVDVQDNRPYVLDGQNSPRYVGIRRSPAGIPWPIRTASGNSLAQDLKASIERSLRAASYRLIAANSSPVNGTRHLHFNIAEWNSEHWFYSTFNYCVQLRVRDNSNTELAATSECGSKELGRNSEFADLKTATTSVITKLINTPAIQIILQERNV